jgi:hypothetical protein
MVVAIGKEAAAAGELAIQRARQAHGQALHTARERTPVLHLGDQVQVVALHGEVHERKAEALFPRVQCAAHGSEQRRHAQRRQAATDTLCHVYGMAA